MNDKHTNTRGAVIGHLLWKETYQVLPLGSAVLGLGVVIYLWLWWWFGATSFDEISILLPHLFALGAPVMMVAHEDETGTLQWTRSLPIAWPYAVFCKWIVALTGLAIIWCAVLLVYRSLVPHGVSGNLNLLASPAAMILSSLCLLSTGFWLAWWLRRPIAVLFAIPVVMTVIVLGLHALSEMLWGQQFDDASRSNGLLVGVTTILTVASIMAGRRTWTKPWGRRRRIGKPTPDRWAPYPPTSVVTAGAPSKAFALLWQHGYQAAPLLLPAAAIGLAASVTVLLASPPSLFSTLAMMAWVLAALAMGAATFVPDSFAERHQFLADRGVSTWTTWWTRQTIPTLVFLVHLLIAAGCFTASKITDFQSSAHLAAWMPTGMLMTAAFVAAQATGVLVRRPTLALLSSPLLLVGLMIVGMPVLILYEFQLVIVLLAGTGLLVLWLLSLRQCRDWLDGRRGWPYYARAAGWIAAGLLVSVAAIGLQRWLSTPSVSPQWHRQTLAEADRQLSIPDGVASLTWVTMSPMAYTPETYCEAHQQLLDTPNTALRPQDIIALTAHLYSVDQAYRQSDTQDQQQQRYACLLDAVSLSLQRYRSTERLNLLDTADYVQPRLDAELNSPRGQRWLSEAQREKIVQRVPTEQELRRLRRDALLRAYAQYSDLRSGGVPQSWLNHTWDSVGLGGYHPYTAMRHELAFERYRTDSLVRDAVRRSLESLEGEESQRQRVRRLEAWQAAWPLEHRRGTFLPTQHW